MFCPPKSFRFIFSYIKVILKNIFPYLGLYSWGLFFFVIFSDWDPCFWHISKPCYHIQSEGFLSFFLSFLILKHDSFHHPWDSLPCIHIGSIFWLLRFVYIEVTFWRFSHKDIKLINGFQWDLSQDNMYHSSIFHQILNMIFKT